MWLCWARLTEDTDTPQLLLRKALKLTVGPVPGSQSCQNDSAIPQAQARVPFLFPPGASPVSCLLDGATGYPGQEGPFVRHMPFWNLVFLRCLFSLPAGYQGPQYPKGALAGQRGQRGRHMGILTSRKGFLGAEWLSHAQHTSGKPDRSQAELQHSLICQDQRQGWPHRVKRPR